MPCKHSQKNAVLLLISAIALANNKSIHNEKSFNAPGRRNNSVCMHLSYSFKIETKK